MKEWVPGYTYNNFIVKETYELNETGQVVIVLEHQQSGAKVIKVACDDPENFFSICFKTLPETSNGVAHVLEHSVLCGSKKYDVRDPFFAMLKRSLATNMNAMTWQDATYYFASTINRKDFFNLLDVFSDAVFFPKLEEVSFLQEGCYLGEDEQGSPLFKGIVFNEMKGALSDPETRFFESMNRALFPATSLGVNSGGDPKELIQLSYQNLKDFHAKNYNIGCATFFFYGDIDLQEQLDFIANEVTDQAIPNDYRPNLQFQPRFKEPRVLEQTFPLDACDNGDNRSLVGIGWIIDSIASFKDVLAMQIIDRILFNHDASPLNKVLLDSQIGLETINHLDTELSEVTYVIGLQDCHSEEIYRFENILLESLKDIIKQGIPKNLITSAVENFHYTIFEITESYGLSMMVRIVPAFLQEGQLNPNLSMIDLLSEIHKESLEGDYLEQLINRYLIKNIHRVQLIMHPDKDLSEIEAKREQALAFQKRDEMSEQEKSIWYDKLKVLSHRQKEGDSEEQIATLPKIKVEELPSTSINYQMQKEKILDVPIYFHSTNTNDIFYFDLVFDINHIPESLISFLPLFCDLFTELGTENQSYDQVLADLSANTGGMGADLKVLTSVHDPHNYKLKLNISFKTVKNKGSKVLKILDDLINQISFQDEERIGQLITKLDSNIQAGISQNGSRLIANYASRDLSNPTHIQYLFGGLGYVNFVHELAHSSSSHLIRQLIKLKELLFCRKRLEVVLTASDEMYQSMKEPLLRLIENIPIKGIESVNLAYSLNPNLNREEREVEALSFSTQVAFTSQVYGAVSYLHEDTAALIVLAQILSMDYLHPLVREQGGSYGVGASLLPLSGVFVLQSYRDPHISRTFKIYDEIAKYLSSDLNSQQLEEGIIQSIALIDTPVQPGLRGILTYLRQEQEMEDQYRDILRKRIFKMTKEELRDVGVKYLQPQNAHRRAVLSGEGLLRKESIADYNSLF